MTDEDKARIRAVKYAGKWWADQHTEEPTDEALRAAFASCVQPPRPELYPLIREAIPAETPPAAAAPLFAALAAYQAIGEASLTPSPRELHTLACHLELLPLAAAPGLHPELRAARDDAEEAWESLHIADNITSRNAAHGTARAAVNRARAVIRAINPHAARMDIADLPATAADVRAAARAYHAVTGTPEELSAIETGSSQVRVHCRSDIGHGRNITATLTAGISTPTGHIPAHPPIVETFARRSGCTDATANAREALHSLLRVDVPVDYVLDHRA
ncbi:hypothetical protein [Streptomyces sp. S1D4-20]|uniref:hypothetical protein n=1 Tax=Streptomyces sp. S1D4-20 TaxID=2594462 RepID=UPI001162FB0E|nr:hypothetical protein [Streptomyces sp. S1D4-20]QDN54076.1 hypothetical protein FNV67_00405 [Streptomyces sp. S1D4-20]